LFTRTAILYLAPSCVIYNLLKRSKIAFPPLYFWDLSPLSESGGFTLNPFLKEEYGFNLLQGGGLVRSMGKTLDVINQSLRHHRILSTEEERELVSALAAGDAQARQALAESQYKLVTKIARKFARNAGRPDLLEDLFQTGVRALLENLENYDPTRGAKLSTFIFRPVTKAILQELKRSTNRESAEELPEQAQDSDRYKALFLVLNQILTPEQSEVVRCHIALEMTFDEIVECNGKSVSTWKRIYASAVERLKRYRDFLRENGLYWSP
jgi:RNA polymerase sigma factor (sigma-70 family)